MASAKEVTTSELLALIDEYVHRERDRHILKRRLIDGIIFEDLAEEFDLSERQVKRIVYRESDKVFKHLGGLK